MQKKETAIEVKVGALVLLATALLVAFVFLLGDFRLTSGYTVNVQFSTSGGLKTGADVALSGMNVGSVSKMEFVRNEDPASGLPAVAVQATLDIDKQYADSVRDNSKFYITTRGVLGEPYVEIITETLEGAAVASGSTLRGVDPPRMEILLGQASEVLETMSDILNDEEQDVGELVANATKFFGVVGDAVGDNRDELDSAISGLNTTATEASKLLAAINVGVGDGQKIRTIVNDAGAAAANARRMTGRLNGQIDPVMADVSQTAANAREISEVTRRLLVDNEGRIVAILDDAETSADNLRQVSDQAVTMVDNVAAGEGTLGALLVEREVYEDLKDLLRVIKQQPWKILWKE
ncbi:hypothetical protein DL240_06570 [Lujinxingia litoralis]|uniref:Mce/MlaD domain-containing protein n=1 Tax=Lujinxingia litoralis TaxID=2211119 RepID=A0A328C7G8_9DELT|nr:MlaD family protein [Lujinxingia litoralis]RAL23813.1 hypothetical protein DL240_06570 [Lujinxingia litoralis]